MTTEFHFTKEEIDQPDEYGDYPIHTISYAKSCQGGGGGKVADMRRLLKVAPEFDLNTPNRNGGTALHICCSSGKPFLAKLLIEAGADVEATDSDLRTPIFNAIRGSNSAVEILCKAKVNLMHKDINGYTPIVYACGIGKVGAVKNICNHEFDINKADGYEKGLMSMLFEASSSWSSSNLGVMVRALIKRGVKLNKVDPGSKRNETLKLSMLIQKSHSYNRDDLISILKSIISAGGNPWMVDSDNKSSFDFLKDEDLAALKTALKRFIKKYKNDFRLIRGIRTVRELKAFYFNQSKQHTKEQVYELLQDNTPAKKYFTQTLALPTTIIEHSKSI